MRHRACLLMTIGLTIGCDAAWAQVATARSVKAVRTETPPVIDGQLDEPCWDKAGVVTSFVFIRTRAPATEQTTAYVLYDETALYLGFRCSERRPQEMKAKFREHDASIWFDDSIEVFLDTNLDCETYFQFLVNSVSARAEHRKGARWDGEWQAKAVVRDDCWTAEMALPFASLGIARDVGDTWGINFCRNKYTKPAEHSCWSYTGQGFGNPKRFGRLTGLEIDFAKHCYAVEDLALSGHLPGEQTLTARIRNLTGQSRKLVARADAGLASGRAYSSSTALALKSEETKPVEIKLRVGEEGKHRVGLVLLEAEPKRVCVRSPAMAFHVVSPLDFAKAETERALDIYDACYRPDPEGPSLHRGDSVHVYLRNRDTTPIAVKELFLGGRRAGELVGEREVAWYRIHPNPIPPGRVSEVIARFTFPLKGPLPVCLLTGLGRKVETTIPRRKPALETKFVAFDRRLRTVYVYVEKTISEALTINRVELDGVDVTTKAQILDPTFHGKAARLTIKPEEPLVYGSFHTVKVCTPQGATSTCMARAWRSPFTIGFFGHLPPAVAQDLATKRFNTYICFGADPVTRAETTKRLLDNGLVCIPQLFRDGFREKGRWSKQMVERAKVSPALFAHFLKDEPDASDQLHKGWLGGWAMELEQCAAFVRQADPYRPTFNVIDNTGRPANYFTYGELTDLVCTDPYVMMRKPVNDLSLVREATRLAYLGCRPRPLSIILWIGGGTKDGTGRFPAPAELRTTAYYALGEGAKGISYFGYEPGSWAGCKENVELWSAIGELNRDLHVVGPVVSRAHSMSIAKGSHENLWVRALVQGNENVVVVVASDSYRSSLAGFTQDTIRDASVHVDLPAGMPIRKAFLIRGGSAQPTGLRRSERGIEVPLGEITTGALLLLTAGDAPPQPDRIEAVPELRAWIEELRASRQANRKQIDSDLVALYHFDEGEGKVAKDSSPFGNDGGVNGAKWVPGRSGHALHFDGRGHYVEVLDSDTINPRAALTIEAWMKISESGSHKIVSKPKAYVVDVWGAKLVGRVILQEELKPKTIYRTVLGRPDTLIPGKWYHVAMTYDSATGELTTYLNGKWESRGIVGAGEDNSLARTSHAMHIGGSPWYGGYSKAVIDEVRVYSRALTADEIRAHYEGADDND